MPEREQINQVASPKPHTAEHREACDFCGSSALTWRKCKLICNDCKQINKSCADL